MHNKQLMNLLGKSESIRPCVISRCPVCHNEWTESVEDGTFDIKCEFCNCEWNMKKKGAKFDDKRSNKCYECDNHSTQPEALCNWIKCMCTNTPCIIERKRYEIAGK